MSVTSPDPDTRVIQSDKELHVGMELPRHSAREIFLWAKKQPWPEGTELEKPADYHVTLLYSPTGHEEFQDAWWIEHLEQSEVTITGITAFPAQDKGYAYVLLIDSDEVKDKAEEMQERARWMGLEITEFDGGYKPHITVAYGPSSRVTGIKAPNFQFDLGASSVSPPRKTASAPKQPPNYREGTPQKHCGNCLMQWKGHCWGYNNKPVEDDAVCDSWAPEAKGKTSLFGPRITPLPTSEEMAQGRQCKFHPDRPAVAAEGFAPMCEECNALWQQRQTRQAYTPGETQALDHLSLSSIAHNLHYKFEEGGLDPASVTAYAKRMLKLVGYPDDEITTQAAIQAWQQLYPQDRLDAQIQALPTTPTESYGYGTTSHVPEKFAGHVSELCYSLGEGFSRIGGLEQYAEMVPVEALDPLREYDRAPGGDPSVSADPEYWNKLKSHIAEHGFENPVTLEYNPHTGSGYIGEGNHRLGIAKELGVSHVPTMVYRSTKDDERMKPMHEPGTYLMRDARGFSQFGQYMKPSDIGLPTAGPYTPPGDHWYQQQRAERAERQKREQAQRAQTPAPEQPPEANLDPEIQSIIDLLNGRESAFRRLGEVATRPLYHWVDASEIHDWMDPSHTGPGHTYLTETGDDPSKEWNPDVPTMNNPVRLTIDPNYLDPSLFDPHYEGWLGNHLYDGVIPPDAVTDIKAFKAPDDWGTSTVPSQVNNPDDNFPEFGDLSPSQEHHDVQFSNDWAWHQGSKVDSKRCVSS